MTSFLRPADSMAAANCGVWNASMKFASRAITGAPPVTAPSSLNSGP